MNNPTVALVDDHVLLRSGLATLVTNLGYHVLFEWSNGLELTENINKKQLPDLVLMDINMPEMDGYQTTLWLKKNYPAVKVIALSMYDEENAIIRMIKMGARGYLLKDSNPQELKRGLSEVLSKGFYYSELVTGRLIRSIHEMDEEENRTKELLSLTSQEVKFLKLAGTEMTYKEIAEQMHLSPRSIDSYRDKLFLKLNIKSRVGLVMFAIKNGVIQMK